MTRSNCMICHPSKSSKIAKIDAKLVKNCNCCPTLVSLFPWLLVRLKSQFITAFNFQKWYIGVFQNMSDSSQIICDSGQFGLATGNWPPSGGIDIDKRDSGDFYLISWSATNWDTNTWTKNEVRDMMIMVITSMMIYHNKMMMMRGWKASGNMRILQRGQYSSFPPTLAARWWRQTWWWWQ